MPPSIHNYPTRVSTSKPADSEDHTSPLNPSNGKFNNRSVSPEPGFALTHQDTKSIPFLPPLSVRSVKQESTQQSRVAQSKNYTGFITRQELEAKINRQQNDEASDFPGIRTVSSAYKTVLSGLENYHRSVKPICPCTKEDALLHLSLMKKQLDILSQSIFIYNNGWPHGNKISMRNLQSLVENEDAKLNTLATQLRNGDKLPQEMTITEALALTQQHVMVKDFQRTSTASENNFLETEKTMQKMQPNAE
ncbi:hypothetical protein HC248_00345 [Polaromonas vacuolata]|uniref:Uncharacterized protein n=1 Tax=Polaromonas vacuolata TaxID=37448 RepID=A0A6H2H5C5_9BURK|nr:hypothetical protein [Polaromonas vacuolata]QJC55082.1 hypothetical protein HC248_00345 [Polaromonas vacuolata]